MTKAKEKEKTSILFKIGTIIGIMMCVLLIPILIMNITLIIKSYTNKDAVPGIGGVIPLIVLSDSMYPDIQSGDMIICHTVDAADIREGDVIAFFDPAGNGTSIVSHRVREVIGSGDSVEWRTKGDANNTEDAALVPCENLVGRYMFAIPYVGNIAMFMQSTKGLIICVVLPIILLVGYDVIRRRIYDKKHSEDTEALRKELEELRAEKKKKDEESS